ncbi:MAG: glycosyltransferase, partial [Candidatus Bathyarchaeia archaeon]
MADKDLRLQALEVEKSSLIDQLEKAKSDLADKDLRLQALEVEKSSLIDQLEKAKTELAVIKDSFGYSLMRFYTRVLHRLLPDGTRRGKLRKILVAGVRIARKEGMRNLCEQVLEKIKRGEFKKIEYSLIQLLHRFPKLTQVLMTLCTLGSVMVTLPFLGIRKIRRAFPLSSKVERLSGSMSTYISSDFAPLSTLRTHNLPLVSIIVLNYNGLHFLNACLSSLFELNYPKDKLEIILVDNGSTDGSVNYVRKKFPNVKVIALKKNIGFSAGNNKGIRASHGKLVAILNNDAEVQKDWLIQIVKLALLDPKIGIIAPKILFRRRPSIINNAGSWMFTNGWSVDRGFNELDKGQYDKIQEVFAACGASMVCRREMLQDVGLFDEDIFAYFEDTDLSWRARLHGWKIVYTPHAVVYHEHAGTSREWSPFFAYHVFRNRLYIALKLGSLRHLIRVLYHTIKELIIALMAQFMFSSWRILLPGGIPYVRIRLRALVDILRYLIKLWKTRWDIGKRALISRDSLENKWFIRRLKIGIYNPYLATMGGMEKEMGVIAELLSRIHIVEFITHKKVDLYELERRFALNMGKVRVKYLPNFYCPLFLTFMTHQYDIFITYTHTIPFASLAKQSIQWIAFPFEIYTKWWQKLNLNTYDRIYVISEFTKYWTRKRLCAKTDVLVPDVTLPLKLSSQERDKIVSFKKNIILNVGRFFTGSLHEKRQDVLIEAFKQMCDDGLIGWELHLAGSVVPEDQPYLKYLQNLARDYPIFFHVNLSFSDISELYKIAKVYWHATGFGLNPEQYPEKQEHFGISTCEAMSMGCVPVVISRGGQPEIVQHGLCGFLWETLEELKKFTFTLINN